MAYFIGIKSWNLDLRWLNAKYVHLFTWRPTLVMSGANARQVHGGTASFSFRKGGAGINTPRNTSYSTAPFPQVLTCTSISLSCDCPQSKAFRGLGCPLCTLSLVTLLSSVRLNAYLCVLVADAPCFAL